MKRLLPLALLVVLSAPAHADHIGIYSDETAQSCTLAPGVNSTAVLIHQYSYGSTGVRFRVDFSHSPSATLNSFNSPFFSLGSLLTDIAIAYPDCHTGSFVIGTLTAALVSGYIAVVPSLGPFVINEACDFTGYPMTGGRAFIGQGECMPVDPVSPSTWGSVKSLYR